MIFLGRPEITVTPGRDPKNELYLNSILAFGRQVLWTGLRMPLSYLPLWCRRLVKWEPPWTTDVLVMLLHFVYCGVLPSHSKTNCFQTHVITNELSIGSAQLSLLIFFPTNSDSIEGYIS
ncbi:hypothetical protein CIHG_08367 [Coccidioides immitis H538.4]|uniref:Uncharacterized protein n=3 Tax=Coccidioides immitis TaxID=5501 RepID=A0A0J8R044_COCIT|nr:hypothetical protein CIRG_06421 [Coccidioides immitis RMSCC 2394]KMU77028.1 hypothetical protein CISG_06264 [Coccidioides immitis RMSCC 3703]KMU90479.1 hypothetical protein CIHG_08367 [Coccidioides immitis H538.4]